MSWMEPASCCFCNPFNSGCRSDCIITARDKIWPEMNTKEKRDNKRKATTNNKKTP